MNAENWRYDIQHGPDGEANYAWVYRGQNMVATMKTHDAKAICDRMNTPDTAVNVGAVVPEGWVLAPIVATHEMEVAGEKWSGLPSQTWTDMLDAVLDPPHSDTAALSTPPQAGTEGETPAHQADVRVLKPVPYDHEITLQSAKAASGSVDGADPRTVLLAVLGCTETWAGDARIIGNVRAVDISIAIRAALAATEGTADDR